MESEGEDRWSSPCACVHVCIENRNAEPLHLFINHREQEGECMQHETDHTGWDISSQSAFLILTEETMFQSQPNGLGASV